VARCWERSGTLPGKVSCVGIKYATIHGRVYWACATHPVMLRQKMHKKHHQHAKEYIIEGGAGRTRFLLGNQRDCWEFDGTLPGKSWNWWDTTDL